MEPMLRDAAPRENPAPRRRGGGCCAVLAIVFLTVVGFSIAVPLQNDAAARAVEDRLGALPLPPGAERIDELSRAGKLVGNGNGMQYLGALLIRSDQSAGEIESFYAGREASFGSDITVTPTTDQTGLDRLTMRPLFSEPAAGDRFIVSAWGEAPSWFHADFDLRGH